MSTTQVRLSSGPVVDDGPLYKCDQSGRLILQCRDAAKLAMEITPLVRHKKLTLHLALATRCLLRVLVRTASLRGPLCRQDALLLLCAWSPRSPVCPNDLFAKPLQAVRSYLGEQHRPSRLPSVLLQR